MKNKLKQLEAWFDRRFGYYFTNGRKQESKKEDAKHDIEDRKPDLPKAIFNTTRINAHLIKTQNSSKLKS